MKRKLTKSRLIARMYKNQCSRRKTTKPTYTYQELKQWLMSQQEFHVLYDNFIRLDEQTEYVPSCDRIDNALGYTLANIQLTTWKLNNQRQYDDIKTGKETTEQMTPVVQYTKDWEFVAEYASMAIAMRTLGITCLYKALQDPNKSAKGFKWTYK